MVMVFNAIFSNISVISWQDVNICNDNILQIPVILMAMMINTILF